MNDETQTSITPASATPDSPEKDADTAVSQNRVETLLLTPEQAARAATASTLTGSVGVPGYEILCELGRGGMGVVYKARHLKLNRIVALKLVLGSQHADPRDLARFIAEAQAVAAIKHPNVIQVFDSGEANGYPFMAMECLEGGSLSQLLSASGRLAPRAAADLLVRIARGVQAAHDSGIVHRDLKPHNILLNATPGAVPGVPGEPIVMDFGLAKRCGAELTTVGTVMGTPAYMAPEQAKGDSKNIGPAADVYALGVVLYECLCGSVPFTGDMWSVILQVVLDEPEPVTRRYRGTPRELDLICHKCLAKEPGERYATAGGLADDLQRFLNGEAIRGPRTGLWYAGRKFARRRWRPAATVAALFGLLLAVSVLPSPVKWARDKGAGEHAGADPAMTRLRELVTNRVDGLRRTPPAPDRTPPHERTRVTDLPTPDHSRFEVFTDERVVDMRGWRPVASAFNSSCVYLTRREVRKIGPVDELRVQTRMPARDVVTRALEPNPEKARVDALDTATEIRRHLVFDVRNIPVDQEFILRYSSTIWNSPESNDDSWFEARCREGALKLSVLLLFPEVRPLHDYHFRFAAASEAEPDRYAELRAYSGPVVTVAAEDKSWLYWEIPNPKANYFYRIDWTW